MNLEEAKAELRQCQTELEEAAKVMQVQYPSLSSIYSVAANRVAAKLNGKPTMGRYRKRPIVVEACQFDGSLEAAEKIAEMDLHISVLHGGDEGEIYVLIDTLEGLMTTNPGDWVIKGVQGEFYPCKPDIFEASYEPVK